MSLIIPVILCGGSRTRLWPASRRKKPKQFLNLFGKDTLLQTTVRRALDLSGASADGLFFVTLSDQKDQVDGQLKDINITGSHILCEPSARNTAAAIAYAAEEVAAHYGDKALMWVLASDQYVGQQNAFGAALREGCKAAESGYLVTFGITPTRPETGYGYILKGDILEHTNVSTITRFVEKPDFETAQRYLDHGGYLWNSGNFLFNVRAVLNEYKAHAPDVLNAVQAAMKGQSSGQAAPALYDQIPAQPFDVAVMEKTRKAAVVPCDPQWSDVGSWESLWELKPKDEAQNVLEGNVIAQRTTSSMIVAGERLIACGGLDNLVVVDTGDAVLIADRRDSTAMRDLVAAIRKDYPDLA
jgi:mannose-1-phosphate guanylyltransferase/mannose-6-phosphate isomerase